MINILLLAGIAISSTVQSDACGYSIIADCGSSKCKVFKAKNGKLVGDRVKHDFDGYKGLAENTENLDKYIKSYFGQLLSKVIKEIENEKDCNNSLDLRIWATAGIRRKFKKNAIEIDNFEETFINKLRESESESEWKGKISEITFYTLTGMDEAVLAWQSANRMRLRNTETPTPTQYQKAWGLLEVGNYSAQMAFEKSDGSLFATSNPVGGASTYKRVVFGQKIEIDKLRTLDNLRKREIDTENKCYLGHYARFPLQNVEQQQGSTQPIDDCKNYLSEKLRKISLPTLMGSPEYQGADAMLHEKTDKLIAPHLTVLVGGMLEHMLGWAWPVKNWFIEKFREFAKTHSDDQNDYATLDDLKKEDYETLKVLNKNLSSKQTVSFKQIQALRRLVCGGYMWEKEIDPIDSDLDRFQVESRYESMFAGTAKEGKAVIVDENGSKTFSQYFASICADMSYVEFLLENALKDLDDDSKKFQFGVSGEATWLAEAARVTLTSSVTNLPQGANESTIAFQNIIVLITSMFQYVNDAIKSLIWRN